MTAPFVPADGGPGNSTKLIGMEDAAFASFLGLEKTHPTPPEPQPRDAEGKFATKDAVALPAEKPVEEAKTETPTAEVSVDEAAIPATTETATEPVEAQPAEPVKPPLTKFQAFDAKGEIEPPSDLLLSMKIDGKMEEKVPLEKVVHGYQQSKYNARQVQELSTANQNGDAAYQQALKTIADYEQGISQMFADDSDSLYVRAKALHRQSNSPEKIAEAAQNEAYQLRQQMQFQVEAGQVAQFITGTIGPVLSDMVAEYPSVTHDDIMGRIALGIKPFEVNGRVPPANLPKVLHWVNTEVADWAATAHASRSEASKKASQSLDKERAVTQAKQRQMGKALAPVGAAAAAPPKTPPIKRASDVLNDPIFGGPQ